MTKTECTISKAKLERDLEYYTNMLQADVKSGFTTIPFEDYGKCMAILTLMQELDFITDRQWSIKMEELVKILNYGSK